MSAGQIKIERVRGRDLSSWGPRLSVLERTSVYPLGADAFRIDHGPDYFAFFRRLGRPAFYIAHAGGEVAAVACVVHRSIPRSGRKPLRAIYACDLKVAPAWRGQHIPVRMAWHGILFEYLRCPRGYGISMNVPGKSNRVARLMEHTPIPIRADRCLAIYSLDHERMRSLLPSLREALGL